MDTAVRTPLEVFTMPQHLVVPLFQRPYVWDQENQWVPLWQDVRRLVGLRLANSGTAPTHFLGAVVLQSMPSQLGSMQSWSIIDGQQRLTTLQLLFDAAASVFEARGLDQITGQLEALTQNPSAFVQGEDVPLKLRHTNRDRAAYDEIMLADPPADHATLTHASSLVTQAHKYFTEQIATWTGEAGEDMAALRASALANVLTQSLQIVVIGLRADENSQEIFETLNARGTPLTAADLIKNFVFQRLAVEGVDTHMAYKDLWPFDTKFWEKEISVGRYPISRGSLFLNQWLVSRVGEEVGPKSTFTRFKHYVEHEAGQAMAALLKDIKEQAGRYREWTERAADPHAALNTVEMCVYRSQAAEIETLKPVLLWLHEPGTSISAESRDRVIATMESWFMRRVLLRLSLGDMGRVIADVIKMHRGTPDSELARGVEMYLSRQNAASTYWPGDRELRTTLVTDVAYRRFKRGRLRMFLEAVEDHNRGYTRGTPSQTGTRVPRVGFPIEHMMPQNWAQHWPVADLAEELEREAHIHRLGNLTLLTSSLNSAVSNGPWLGENGKRAKLERHDVLLMNRRIRESSTDGWNEEKIDERTSEVVDALIATWRVPEGHLGTVSTGTLSAVPETTTRELVASGLLPAGTVLRARYGQWGDRRCEVLGTGELLTDDGKKFTTPSGAGHHIRKGATNGWSFWELPDGRRLSSLRTEYHASRRNPEGSQGNEPTPTLFP
ncbi:GmrSD restriction endonuclease domain-containing protein [Pseudarthrobacter oxydans]|uniref:GmrSD restriction endonuclease domain-containing protein n=2 Tax=Pseudarthrobacter oxydans TaxID=1671 RepID=UPI0034325490